MTLNEGLKKFQIEKSYLKKYVTEKLNISENYGRYKNGDIQELFKLCGK